MLIRMVVNSYFILRLVKTHICQCILYLDLGMFADKSMLLLEIRCSADSGGDDACW